MTSAAGAAGRLSGDGGQPSEDMPDAGGPNSVGGEESSSLAGSGAGGGPTPLALPSGAFAWYKANADDVTTKSASLGDGNDLIKDFWEKSNLTAWKDRIASRDFVDPTGGWRWLPSSTTFNALPALQSFYLYGPKLEAGVAADWKFLHDGSGGTVVLLQQQQTPSQGYPHSLVSEYDAANEGVHLGVSNKDAKEWEYSVTNADGKAVFAAKGGSTSGVKWLGGSYGSQQEPQGQLFEDGILVGSGKATASPALTTGNFPLSLGGRFGPSQQVHEVLVYDRTLTLAEISQLKAYFAAELGN